MPKALTENIFLYTLLPSLVIRFLSTVKKKKKEVARGSYSDSSDDSQKGKKWEKT